MAVEPYDWRRDIKVALTESEWNALKQTVDGELESLTEADWESGVYDALDDASSALAKAGNRYRRRLSGVRDA